jgi:ATP-dependent Zn protease
MESKGRRNPDNAKSIAVGEGTEYREAVRKQLNAEVKKIIDLEMQKAAQELIEERKNATRQMVEEYKTLIHQIVEEQKAEIWKEAETLKKSMLQLGL